MNRYIKQLLVLLTPLSCFSSTLYPVNNVKKTDFTPQLTNILLPTPPELKKLSVQRLRTLAVQKDNWSCAYHALFNAMAIHGALTDTAPFYTALSHTLGDPVLFNTVYKHIQTYVGKNNKPLHGDNIHTICKQLPIANQSLALFLTPNNELMIPCLYAQVEHPLTMPKKEIEKLLHEKRKLLVHTKIKDMLATLQAPPDARYFFCNLGNHYILIAIIKDRSNKPTLYVIGAWNEPLNEQALRYIKTLNNYLQQLRNNVQHR